MENKPPKIETVNGQVAHTINNNPGPPPPQSRQERRLKEAFPKVCHAELDYLLENSDLTATDLLKAKKHYALSCKKGRLIRQHERIDRYAGTFFLIQLLIMLVAVAVTALMTENFNSSNGAAFWFALAILSVCMLFIGSVFFFPQATAKQAMLSLQDRQLAEQGCL